MTRALDWAYEQAQANIPGMGSAIDLAKSHLKSAGGAREKAIDDLIAWLDETRRSPRPGG